MKGKNIAKFLITVCILSSTSAANARRIVGIHRFLYFGFGCIAQFTHVVCRLATQFDDGLERQKPVRVNPDWMLTFEAISLSSHPVSVRVPGLSVFVFGKV